MFLFLAHYWCCLLYRQCFTGVPTVNEMVLYVPGLPVAPLYSVEIDISFI